MGKATSAFDTPSDDTVSQLHPEVGDPANRIVPDAVTQRFLRVDNLYFFPDRSLAFVDTGTRLEVRTHNLEVVHSIVAIMRSRGWRAVQVAGTRAFRKQLWHEATLQGIGVHGYQPHVQELQQLQRASDRSQAAALRPAEHPPRPPTSGLLPAKGRKVARDGVRPPITGVLLAHAACPYRFDPMQSMSYYVRVRTRVGERTLWGADLERAIAESRSGAQVGDEVVLGQRGARPVTVRVPDRNEAGELLGEKRISTSRMAWTVEKVQYLASLQRKADIVRTGQMAAGAMLSRYPELAGAVVALKLAEQFARRLSSRTDDQARLVQAIRNRLGDAIAHGERIKIPAGQQHARHRGRTVPRIEDPLPTRA
ncbi:LPD7 domain-containing protein [Variovorax sp. MHTC-1]|uniref:LPD7 domain-containing protein n=1 Tax=Variovorax sp. MHTC-1 TaxID=2495593 RepID=UPI000F8822E1|nr:LPD7 domain-containing protein [Variovorax sp. MHTC-1]RST50023.1 hypothetical protein EJI01_22540 [Variovorax sp. MHTC-1]